MKKVLLVVLLVIMVVPVTLAQAPWTAWLYDYETGEIWQVDQTGTVLINRILPTVMAHDRYSDQLTVSEDGQRMAYSVYSTSMNTTQFLVYDVASDAMIASYTPPPQVIGDSPSVSGVAFNRLGTAVAYGYLLESVEWQMVVLDITTNSVIFQLSSTDPAVAGIVGDFPYTVPIPQAYGSAEVHYTILPYGTEGPLQLDSYRWDLLTNSVTETAIYNQLYADTLPSSKQVAVAMFDERLPNIIDTLMFPIQFNTVQIYDPAVFGRFPVLANADWTFSGPTFIEGGVRLIAPAYILSEDRYTYPIIQRNGTIDGYAPIVLDRMNNIKGTSAGFVYLANPAAATPSGYSSALYYVNSSTAIDSGTLLWTSDRLVSLAWVGPRDAMESAGLAAWTMLAPPVSMASGASVSPADAAPGDGEVGSLTIGGLAVINTTDGDRLNMRSGPGVDFSRLARLADGATVTVLEGPVATDGFIWWRVRTVDGTEGWVVQEAEDVRTLIPAS